MKAFQIGIFGHTAAGKTSLLLSLASSRNSRLSKTTATLVPLNEAQVTSAQANAFKQGQEWLTDARKKLAQGGPVDGNVITTNHLLLEYDVSRVGGVSHRVHIFDYAGELLGADKQTDALAHNLVKTLSKLDGLIVMLPVCHPSDEIAKAELSKRLKDLAQTFTLIKQYGDKRGSQLSIPIALVLSKWDILAESNNYEHEQTVALKRLETAGYEGFLNLYRTLEGVTLSGNFSFSVMSAFGPCELKSTRDGQPYSHPIKVDPLDAFGVVEPLVWLCERSQVQVYEQLSKRAGHLESQGSLDNFRSPLRPWRLAQDLKMNSWRYHLESQEYQNMKLFRRAAVRHHWMNMFTSVAALLVVTLCVEAIIDQRACRKALANIEQADSSWADVEESNLWLQSYIRSSSTRHLFYKPFFSRADAQELSLKYGERFSKRFWENINTELNIDRKEAMLLAYIRDFPNSSYTSEAHTALKSLRATRERMSWETPLSLAPNIEAKITVLEEYIAGDSAQKDEVLPLLQALKKERDDNAWSVVIAKGQKEAQREAVTSYLKTFPDGLHGVEAHQLIAQLDANREWEIFLGDYKDAMDRKITDAYELLKAREDGSDRMKALRAQFAHNAHTRIMQEVNRLVSELDYSEALKQVVVYRRFDEAFTTPELLNSTYEKYEELRRGYDQHLYNQILQAEQGYPGSGGIACREYITAWNAREIHGVMSDEVQRLLNSYNESKNGQFRLYIDEMGSDCSLIEEGTTFLLSGLPETQTSHQIPDAVTFTTHAEQRFSLQITAQRDSWGTSNPSYHHYEELSVSDLLGHMRNIELACDDDGSKYKVRLRIDKIEGTEIHRLSPWKQN